MKKLASLIMAIGLIMACSTGKKVALQQDNNISLEEVVGIYRGTLPCADCEGIKTEIVLEDNGRYNISRVYIGKKSARFHNSGMFNYNKQTGEVRLIDKKGESDGLYLLEDYSLVMLDADGGKIEGELAEMYILEKATEYDLVVFDQGFDSWLRSNPISVDYYSNEYLQSMNIRYVEAWNRRYIRGDRRIESYLDYDPSNKYNKDFNFKLFMYFKYYEETNRMKLL